MDKNPKQILSGLINLKLGLDFEAILSQFRTPFNSDLIRDGVLDTNITPFEFYKYDPELDVRITNQDDGDGLFYEVTQSFDDYFINKIQHEEDFIFDALEELVFTSVTFYSLEIRLKTILKQLNDIPVWNNLNGREPLTEATSNCFNNTVKKIKDYICEQLNFKEESIKPLTEQINLTVERQFPDLIVSDWANSHPSKISKLYTELKTVYIKDEKDKSEIFVKMLRGIELPAKEDRIVWDNQRALKYLVLQLESLLITTPPGKGKNAFTFPSDKWKWVKNCFVNLNGSEFLYVSNDKTEKLSIKTRAKIDEILHRLVK